MRSHADMRIVALSKTFASISAAAVMVAGVVVFAGGWGLDITVLKSILPRFGIMQPNTALGFVLAGVSLWILGREPVNPNRTRLSNACAVIVLLIGSATLGEYLFEWPSGLDRLFFPRAVAELQPVDPGRMSPNTALNYVFIGLALLMIDRKSETARSLAQVFSFAAGFVALLSLTGYAYEVVPFYRIVSFTQMAVHTAGSFVLLSLGVVFSRPDRGLMVPLTSDQPGGIFLRRLLPAVIVIPLAAGWLRLAGERAGFYGTEFGAALMVVLTILVFEILIWKNASVFNRIVGERQRVEEERDQFFNLSLDMMCIAGFDGYFKHLNPSWEETLGWTVEELCAKPYLEFIHPDDREKTIDEAGSYETGGITLSFENRYLCKDGSYRWLQWNAIPLTDRKLIFASARDVTALKMMRAERDQFFNLSPDLLAIGGFDGFIKQANPAWEKMLGWTSRELFEKPYIQVVHPDDRESVATESKRLASGARTISFECRFMCKDGSFRWFQWNAFPLVEQKLIYGAARDITERKKTESDIQNLNNDLLTYSNRLEAANKELEAFAYSVSHDLRAPLRGIDGFSLALLEDYQDKLDEQGRDYLTRVRGASQKMAQLIDDILSLSRVTRGEMRSESVDLSRLVNEIFSEIRVQYPSRQVECRIAGGLSARGDERLLRVAMENLLNNAWKFTSKRPEAVIEFGATSNNGGSAYFVRDNGAGFDMAYADKLFGVFQRLHAVTEYDGTGVGLATVQRIINRHGGKIWAEAAVDKGATFYFILPMPSESML